MPLNKETKPNAHSHGGFFFWSLCYKTSPILPRISSSPSRFSKIFRYCSKASNYDWYHCQLHVSRLIHLDRQVLGNYLVFRFSLFQIWNQQEGRSLLQDTLVSPCLLQQDLIFGSGLADPFLFQRPRELHVFQFLIQSPFTVIISVVLSTSFDCYHFLFIIVIFVEILCLLSFPLDSSKIFWLNRLGL